MLTALYTARNPLVVARIRRFLVTSAATPTPIMGYVPRVTGTYAIWPIVKVSVAATVVSLAAAWTDPDIGPDTYAWYTNTNVPTGTALQAPILVDAQAGQPITVTVTAGTANQVRVSCSVVLLP